MLKLIKNLLERSSYAIAITFTVLIIYMSLASTSNIVAVIDVSDKTMHSFAYFVLSLSWFFAIKPSYFELKTKVKIGFLVLLLSIILEILQGSITSYRTADYLDVIANTIGILFAVILFKPLLRLYHTI